MEKDADLIEQKKWLPIVKAALVLMLACLMSKLIASRRIPGIAKGDSHQMTTILFMSVEK